ncbi:MAG: NAD(P)H-dependent glycerol-3-phosphate dehydrogenase [Sphingobacterium sp.]
MNEISVVGGGSWATAIVKILTENKVKVNWYIRRRSQIESINSIGINPDYLSNVELDKEFIWATDDLQAVLEQSSVIIILIPSSQLENLSQQINGIHPDLLSRKTVVTSIKGTVGSQNELPSAFLSNRFRISEDNLAIIGGPCHAEEIGRGRKTYMTICSVNTAFLKRIAPCFSSNYLQVETSTDSLGVEYAAIYKNVVGLVCGMAKGLNYGDNFIAVVVANAIKELGVLLEVVGVPPRELANSSYLGDLLVTGYSAHSRNRSFGELIGIGYSVVDAQEKMSMIAEGYSATKGLYEIAHELHLYMPILYTAYRILYKHMPVNTEFNLLERNLK